MPRPTELPRPSHRIDASKLESPEKSLRFDDAGAGSHRADPLMAQGFLSRYVKWTETAGHWGGYEVQNKKFYEPGMVHFVYEKENGNAFTATGRFYGFFRRGEYRDLISAFVVGGQGADPKTQRYRAASEIAVSDNTIWPWSTAKHLGVQGAPGPATDLADYETEYEDQILNDTWRKFREPLMYTTYSPESSATKESCAGTWLATFAIRLRIGKSSIAATPATATAS